jgi:hypothetical protein
MERERITTERRMAYIVGALCGVQLGHERPYHEVLVLLVQAPSGTRLSMLHGAINGVLLRARRGSALRS